MLQICGSLSGLLFACPDRFCSLRYYSKKRLSPLKDGISALCFGRFAVRAVLMLFTGRANIQP